RRARDDLERRMEERTLELIRASEQLRQEIAERERSEARLDRTYELEAIGRLTGGIAHDLNNLMAIVTVNCDLLRRRLGEGAPALAYVEDIARAGARAATLAMDLPRAGVAGGPLLPAPALEPSPVPASSPPPSSARILVVEDQDRLRDVIGLVLKSSGYE